MKRLTFLALPFILSGVLAGTATAAEVKIGAVLPLTGPVATYGQSAQNAIKLAVDELNKAKFLGKDTIKVVYVDSKGETAESANAVNKLIERDKVVSIIGDLTSSCTLASGPIAQSMGIPMITATSTNDKVSGIGDFVFRSCFTDSFQGSVMAKFAAKNMKYKKVAILTAMTSDYSKGLARVFKDDFAKMGGKVVAEENYQEADQDFNAQLTKIKSSKPDAIYLPGYYVEVGLIARQARQLGITAPFLGGDGYDSEKLYDLAKDAIVGSYFTNHYTRDAVAKTAAGFLTSYKAKYKAEPDAMAALSYDCTKILANALKASKSYKPEAIKKALGATVYKGGVSGNVKFDKDRNPIKDAVVLRVEKGNAKYSYVATVTP